MRGADGEEAILRRYLQEIRRIPLLSAEEERETALRAQEGDEQALRKLVESNLRFVASYARRYAGRGISLLDLIDEGNLGLMEAARRFDPDRGVRFLTYAVWWVRRSILNSLSARGRSSGSSTRPRRVEAESTEDDAADAAEREDDRAFERRGWYVSSLFDPAVGNDEDDQALVERLEQQAVPSPEDELLKDSLERELSGLVEQLSPREVAVLQQRFGLTGDEPRTLQEIADQMGLTRQRIQQIERAAIEKLRQSRRAASLRAFLN